MVINASSVDTLLRVAIYTGRGSALRVKFVSGPLVIRRSEDFETAVERVRVKRLRRDVRVVCLRP